MKHSTRITILLVLLFLLTQYVGIAIINQYIDREQSTKDHIAYKGLPFNVERPQIKESISYLYILSGILLGTGLLLIIIKFGKRNLWKLWFFLSVFLCLTVAAGAFFNEKLAALLALFFALWKIYKPNVIVHNLTEVLIYGGLAAIFVPFMNLWSAIILLVLISIYDMIAVWKIKHMITLAQFQTDSKVFAGILIPYMQKSEIKASVPKKTTIKIPKNVQIESKHNAVLGGGDMAFPLLFAGVIMKTFGIGLTLIIPVTAALALAGLLYYSEKGKFYPAMPFISIGCFVGLLIVYIL